MHGERGAGCAITMAAFLGIATITLIVIGYWAVGMFTLIAFSVIVAGLLDPG